MFGVHDRSVFVAEYFICMINHCIFHHSSGNADVNSCETSAKGEGGTPPLVVAAKGSHKEIMKLLLNYGADVNYPEMHHGHTALAAAAELGLPEVCQLLLGKAYCQLF